MIGMFIFLFFQVVAAHEPAKFPETRSKVSTVAQQINALMNAWQRNPKGRLQGG